jgi:hypothetical protein
MVIGIGTIGATGIIAVVGIVMGTVTTGFMVTKGSAVELAEVMNSAAGTAFTAEARCAAASTVVAAQVMDTGKSGFFA